jgi:hypothetical protein
VIAVVMVVDVIVAGIMMTVVVIDVIIAGIMMMMVMVVDIIVTGVIRKTVRRRRRRRRRRAIAFDVIVTGVMRRRTVKRWVIAVDGIVTGVMRRVVRRTVSWRAIAVDVIATSDDFSRRSRRKGGKDEGNENFELHICLEY